MTTPASSLSFPHPTLTKILGIPSNSTIHLLTKEIYANACAVPSTRGGSRHGHLGLVMPAAEYLITTGVNFQLPVHPGPAPIYATSANAAVWAEATRIYDAMLKELATATTVKEEIKKQLLASVDRIYLATLDDNLFGFADVSIAEMLNHLRTTYGPITCAELECNCASIATVWTPDDPIEHLWECLREIQRISAAGNDPLMDNTIIDLTFTMFEATGMFTTACDTWRIHPIANKMLIEFCIHFTSKNKEHLHKLTTGQVGFHSAHAAISTLLKHATTPPLPPKPLLAPIPSGTAQPPAIVF